MGDPIDDLLSEEKVPDGGGDNSQTSDESRKIEVDGEELDEESIRSIVQEKKDLERRVRQQEKDYKNLQKLASRKGLSVSSSEEQTEEDDDLAGIDEETIKRDRRYLAKKVGVITREDWESERKKIMEEARSEAKVNSEAVRLRQEVEKTARDYPFVKAKEVTDYMHARALVGEFVSPEEAAKRLYPVEFRGAKPEAEKLPQTDNLNKGIPVEPEVKTPSFDNPRAMSDALMEVMFPGEVE